MAVSFGYPALQKELKWNLKCGSLLDSPVCQGLTNLVEEATGAFI